MKKIVILLLVTSATIYAASSTIMPSDVIRLVKTPIEHWHGQFVNVSWSVFRYLMFFEIILLFGMKFLKGDFELGSVMGDLIRTVLIFGFFSVLNIINRSKI